MARIGSGDWLDVGTWTDEEDPGAGSQDFQVLSDTGLNGNWKRLWKAISTVFSAFGVFKDNVVDGNAIKSSAVDGTSLEKVGNQFRVKDNGVSESKLATGAVTESKLGSGAVTATKLASDAVETAKIKDSNVTTSKIADDAVTAGKISHDNNRTKFVFTFSLASGFGGNAYFSHGGIASNTIGGAVVMGRDGSITGAYLVHGGAGGGTATVRSSQPSYGTATFSAGDRIGCYMKGSPGAQHGQLTKNGADFLNIYQPESISNAAGSMVVVEGEYDD